MDGGACPGRPTGAGKAANGPGKASSDWDSVLSPGTTQLSLCARSLSTGPSLWLCNLPDVLTGRSLLTLCGLAMTEHGVPANRCRFEVSCFCWRRKASGREDAATLSTQTPTPCKGPPLGPLPGVLLFPVTSYVRSRSLKLRAWLVSYTSLVVKLPSCQDVSSHTDSSLTCTRPERAVCKPVNRVGPLP